MKKSKQLFKVVFIVAVFALAFMGFRYSSYSEKIAGEIVTVHSLSLTSQAFGGCENSSPFPTGGYGTCNSFGRCAYSGGMGQCQ